MSRGRNKKAASDGPPPSHPQENFPEHRKFLIRSLERNDAELAALVDLNRSLKAVKAAILESCGEPVLLDLGIGRLTLVNDELHEGKERKDEESTQQHHLTPVQKALCVDFLLRMKLRRKLCNRLARRLNRVAHAMDGEDVAPPPPPRYGDLRLNIDPSAVQAKAEHWKRLDEAKNAIAQVRQAQIEAKEAAIAKARSDSAVKKEADKSQAVPNGEAADESVKEDQVIPMHVDSKSPEETPKAPEAIVSSAKFDAFENTSHSSSLAPHFDVVKEHDSSYEKTWDATKKRFKYIIADEEVVPEYTQIKQGNGIGGAPRPMSSQEREAEHKRWQTALLSRIPEQPTFEDLGLKNRVFCYEARKKRCLEQEESQEEESQAEPKKTKTSDAEMQETDQEESDEEVTIESKSDDKAQNGHQAEATDETISDGNGQVDPEDPQEEVVANETKSHCSGQIDQTTSQEEATTEKKVEGGDQNDQADYTEDTSSEMKTEGGDQEDQAVSQEEADAEMKTDRDDQTDQAGPQEEATTEMKSDGRDQAESKEGAAAEKKTDGGDQSDQADSKAEAASEKKTDGDNQADQPDSKDDAATEMKTDGSDQADSEEEVVMEKKTDGSDQADSEEEVAMEKKIDGGNQADQADSTEEAAMEKEADGGDQLDSKEERATEMKTDGSDQMDVVDTQDEAPAAEMKTDGSDQAGTQEQEATTEMKTDGTASADQAESHEKETEEEKTQDTSQGDQVESEKAATKADGNGEIDPEESLQWGADKVKKDASSQADQEESHEEPTKGLNTDDEAAPEDSQEKEASEAKISGGGPADQEEAITNAANAAGTNSINQENREESQAERNEKFGASESEHSVSEKEEKGADDEKLEGVSDEEAKKMSKEDEPTVETGEKDVQLAKEEKPTDEDVEMVETKESDSEGKDVKSSPDDEEDDSSDMFGDNSSKEDEKDEPMKKSDDDESSDMFDADDEEEEKAGDKAPKPDSATASAKSLTEPPKTEPTEQGVNSEEKKDGTEDDEEEKKPIKPMSLVAVPSFYDQDMARVRMIHGDLVTTSIIEHSRKRLSEVTRDYNTAFRTSNELYDQRQQLQQNLNFFIAKSRNELAKVNNDYALKVAIAKQRWIKQKHEYDVKRAQGAMPSNWGHKPFGTNLLQNHIQRKQDIRALVGACLADVVDGSIMVAEGKVPNKKFGDFVAPPNPSINKQTGESLAQQHLNMENQLRRQLNDLNAKFHTSEEERKRIWKKMMKTKTELEMPQTSYSGRRGRVDFSQMPVPPLRNSTQQSMPSAPDYARAALATYTPPPSTGFPQDMGASDSKYSAARVRERIGNDGTVAPVTEPKKTKEGLYQRPAGRTRKGMQWDAIRGIWVPEGSQ